MVAAESSGAPEVGASEKPARRLSSVYVPELDGIRGIAVIAVMIRHLFSEMELATSLDRGVHAIARLGSNGVDVFFVLSGFLITGILLDTKDGPGYLRRFYWRRVLRIFPLYYLALVIAFWIWPLVLPGKWHLLERAYGHEAWYFTYTTNWLFALKDQYVGMAHFWSLAIEEQFYLVWPFVVLALGRRSLMAVCGTLFLLTPFLRDWLLERGLSVMSVYVMTHTRMDSLALGALVACLVRSAPAARMPAVLRGARLAWPGALMVLAAMVLRVRGGGRDALLMSWGVTLIAVLAAAAILLALPTAPDSPFKRALRSRGLVAFGRYSYCLYVAHPFVIAVVERYVFPRDTLLPRIHGSALPGRLVFVLICTLLTWGVARASWELWEKRWLALKERV